MKILRINLSKNNIVSEDLPSKYQHLSARGLVSKLVLDEIDPLCDPLGINNKIFFSSGFLAGTNVSSSGRVSLGTKSPLTGGIKESSSGGTLGMYFGRLGIRALAIENGSADNWVYLYIGKEEVSLKSAEDLVGLGCYETTKKMKDIYGSRIGVLSIGPAGEQMYLSSCISVTDKDGDPTRQFGRGGVGAVLGAKKIKAIVIDGNGTENIKPLNEEKAKIYNKLFVSKLMENPVSGKSFPKYGTNVLVNIVNAYGALPTHSFREGSFEHADNISGEKMNQILEARGGQVGHSCMPGCVIRCSNVYVDESGKNITGGFEYESVCLLGSNLGIGDLDDIARLNRICDDVGVDTVECGVALGVAMDSGIIEFGNFRACEEILNGMYSNKNFLSRIIGQGAKVTGKVFNNLRVPEVKGQAMAAYDPRPLTGMGLVYCSSPMGADHTAGASCTVFMKNEKEKHVDITINSIIQSTALENTGLCRFTSYAVNSSDETLNALLELINAYTGLKLTPDQYFDIGKEINGYEIKFNELAGLTNVDNKLPEFMRSEKLDPKSVVFDIDQNTIDEIVKKIH